MVKKALAWGVHLYTASGLVLAAVAAVLIIDGTEQSLRNALIVLFLALLVDSTDGTLARKARVKTVLPGIDGRRLDDIIDFQTYTSLPLLLILQSGLLPGAHGLWLLFPLLASAYGFSQAEAKTSDGYFRGFPSYWNVVALYFFFMMPSLLFAVGVLVFFSVLTFLPIKYLYPSQRGPLQRTTIVLGAVWMTALLLVLFDLTAMPDLVIIMSLFFPVYYLVASWFVSFVH